MIQRCDLRIRALQTATCFNPSRYPVIVERTTHIHARIRHRYSLNPTLVQLAQRIPPDALPQRSVARVIPINENIEIDFEDFADCEGLTLILACRNVSKANAARTELLHLLYDEVERIKRKRGGADAKHAELFRQTCGLLYTR